MKNCLIAAVLLFGAGRAYAFGWNTCDGSPLVWAGHDNLTRNTLGIPTGGAAHSAYLNAINRWNAVSGMNDIFVDSGTTASGSIVHGDGQNDVALVQQSVLGNNVAGLTIVISSACVFDSHLIETDVMIASDLDFTVHPDEATVAQPARVVFLHEFGHALGLNHTSGYDLMRPVGPIPLMGGPGEHADVLPDDAAGGRFLYPSGFSQTNVFASAQLRDSNDTIQNNTGVGPVFSCSGGGGKITIDATVGNNGTVNIQQTERWFLSTSKTAYGGTLFFQWNNSTYNADSALTIQRTMTMPALPVGTYFLFHAVDGLNQWSESREDDNVAREALIVKVISC